MIITKTPELLTIPQQKKVGIYCRVSSNTRAQLHSLSAQASYLLRYVNKNFLLSATDIFLDVCSGANTEKRYEFQRMIDAVKNGSINYVITKSISRFGRSTEEVLTSVRLLKSLNVEVYFEEQQLSSFNKESELYISLYAGIAQAENRQHSENVRWGIKRSVESGKSNLYTKPCYGYRLDEHKNLYVVQEEAAVVRRIFTMYLSDMSVLKIKYQLEADTILSPTGKGNWSKRTIEFILSNEKYYGVATVYKSITPIYASKRKVNIGEHDIYRNLENNPLIISEDIFKLVQDEKVKRSNIMIDANGERIRKNTKYSSKM